MISADILVNSLRMPRCAPRWQVARVPDLDADRVGDAGQVAGVAGDHGGLVTDGGYDDDRVDHVGGPGGGAGDTSGAAGALVVGEDVAGFEYPGDLVLGTAAPGLGQDVRMESPGLIGAGLLIEDHPVHVEVFANAMGA